MPYVWHGEMRNFTCDQQQRVFASSPSLVKILHTADWQIGMGAKHVGARSADVRVQRIESARRLGGIARTNGVDAIFVAGDVFEDNAVDRIDVQRVIDVCVSFGLPTYVLPGNHDPLTTGSVWEHPSWAAATNVTVLRTSAPLKIAPGVTLYPCPARAKYSSVDPTAWIAGASFEGTRIGIAHGTVTGAGIAVAEDCFPIRHDAASRAGLDYLALGHWHSTASYEGDGDTARMAYSGTHETTKFGERDSGNVLIVDVPGRGGLPRVTRVPTGALRWHQLERELGSTLDVERIIGEVQALPDPSQSLLELRLRGFVAPAQLKELERLRQVVAARFPLLGRIDESKLIAAPSDDSWALALPAGLLRDVAAAVQAGASENTAQALMLLYTYGTELGQVTA